MNDLTVFNRGGQLYTDSRDVAKMVGKQHKNLIRNIARYTETMKKSTERKIASSDFFTGSTYTDPTGRTLPCYLITKKGCEFVANKLTGRAFHRQEQQYYHAHLGPARYVWVLFLLVSKKIIKRHSEIVGYLLELICFGNASVPFPVA